MYMHIYIYIYAYVYIYIYIYIYTYIHTYGSIGSPPEAVSGYFTITIIVSFTITTTLRPISKLRIDNFGI